MLQQIRSLCVFLSVSSFFLVSQAQFFDTGAASLGSAPVGFISRVGVFGDRDSITSLGNAPVGVYQRRQYPQRWYQVPRIPVVEIQPPAKPPVVRPPVKSGCRLPGPCRNQVVKPVRPVRPPPPRSYYKPVVRPPVKSAVRPPVKPVVRPPVKPAVRPPVKPVVRPPVKPGVRPPVRPGVRPPKRIIRPFRTRRPKTNRPSPTPKGVEGRLFGGMLGGILG